MNLFSSKTNSSRTRDGFFDDLFADIFIEDDLIIRADGTVSAGFHVNLPNREKLDEDSMIVLLDNLEKVFSRLPVGTVVHFQGQHWYAEESVNALLKNANGYLGRKIAFHLLHRPVMNSRCVLYLCFNLKATNHKNSASTSFSAFTIPKNHIADIETTKRSVKEFVKSFLTQSKNLIGCTITQLDVKGLEIERGRYFNLNFAKNETSLSNEAVFNGHSVSLGNQIATTVYMSSGGNIIYDTVPNDRGVHSFMPWTMGYYLPFPHVVNLSFKILKNDDELKKLDRKKNLARSLGSLQGEDDRVIISSLEDFTLEARTNNLQLVHINHNVMVWDTNPDRLRNNVDIVKAAYTRMNGAVGLVHPYEAGNYFITYSPGMAQDMFQYDVQVLRKALCYFDYTQPKHSDGKGIVFCNRENEPFIVDMDHPLLPNKNAVSLGPTGSGKSFTWNSILSQLYEQGNQLVILDIGGSYKSLVELYGGKYYEYSSDRHPISFNPFLIPQDATGMYILSSDKIVFLLGILTLLWKDTKKGDGLTQEEQSILTEILTNYYSNINRSKGILPGLKSFVDFCTDYFSKKENKDNAEERFFDLTSFTLVLKKFVKGSYANLLGAEKNENIADYNMICFDLQGIQNDHIAFPVVSLIIIELILDKLRANPNVLKRIVIDEGWALLQGFLSGFIENSYRTIRKHGGGVTLISQSIIELKDSPIGQVIKANSAIRLLLDHSSVPALIPDVQAFFGMTEHQVELFRSLRNQGSSREALLFFNDEPMVVSIDVGPHATAAFSSKAEDRALRTQLTEKAGAEYAINQMVESTNK